MDYVASAERWKVKKPAPRFFQRIVDKLQLEACSIAYVGDRLDDDILPALGADMIAVFIRRGPWGFLHSRRPEAARAHLRTEDLNELPDALARARLIA